ncbi:MAG: carbohydrate ABC transporter permease, partial [Chloroflexota bacterium]
QLGLGLLIAFLLNQKLRLVGLLRTVFVIPMVLPPVVVAIIWKVLYTPDISVINYVLGLVGLPKPGWIGDPNLALWSIAIADIWEWFPFSMLMLLAALQMLPEEPMEAALIDGASYWQSLRYITLPLLKPAILLVVIFRIIESIKAFPLIFIMTMGGPGMATEPTNFYAYLQSFNYDYVGYGSAISTVMVVMVILITLAIMRVSGEGTEVE